MRRKPSSVTGFSARARSCRWLYIVMSLSRRDGDEPAWPMRSQTSIGAAEGRGIVVLAPALHRADPPQQVLVVLFAPHRIDGRGIDDQQRSRVVTVKEIHVGLGQAPQVFGAHALLVGD